MKNIKLISLLIFILVSLSIYSSAQVPNYVPTNGLIGWWPFNGNANDESGNGKNGTISGAILATDRSSIANSAYSFNGGQNITIGNFTAMPQQFTINLWFYPTTNGGAGTLELLHRCQPGDRFNYSWNLSWGLLNGQNALVTVLKDGNTNLPNSSNAGMSINNWHMATLSYDGLYKRIFVNGIKVDSLLVPNFSFGYLNQSGVYIGYDSQTDYFYGKIDDIGIWNRALSQSEILLLFTGCNTSISSQPSNFYGVLNGLAQFNVSSLDSADTFQWQTDLGTGFINLTNAGQYSGTNINSLTVANLTLQNNNQQFRCIATGNGCSDTSSAAVLNICSGTIIAQPSNQVAALGANALFTVGYTGSGSYQWQSDLGFGFQDLSNAGQYSGVNSGSLTVSIITNANNNQLFRCVITDNVCVDTTNVASLQIGAIGISDFKPCTINIYPSPTSNILCVEITGLKTHQSFEIYNVHGQSMQEGWLYFEKSHLDVSQLKDGLYFISINHEIFKFEKLSK